MSFMAHARRLGAVTAIAALLPVTVLTGSASAHVTANPRTAEQGGYTKVSFRVPNERDGAGTTKVRIDLPPQNPIAHVSVRPVPGWTVKVEKAKLPAPVKTDGGELTEAVSRITWSGGEIEPGQFQEFDVSLGPLPAVDRLLFKAEQTYSGGEVVRWDQDPGDGEDEPEHPAPVLQLVPKQAENLSAALAPDDDDDDDETGRVIGALGIVGGVLGVVIGSVGIARSRRSRA
ncbi:YcnI family protein [Spirillospora albida]|uniref:YcnI family copper-binding membrane protein n=1 Tax=Spirillospora albida TaxID=58123 RepID=UPI000A82AD56|nr:YcnI family protein [Spirillospora albida]